jgi:hypothetical protein
MNCPDCRRQLLIDPGSRDPELLAHLNGCPACRDEAERAWRFEEKLRRGLRSEPPGDPVPLFRASTHRCDPQSRHSRNLRRGTIAAVVVLFLALPAWLTLPRHRATNPEDMVSTMVLRHIDDEPEHLHARGDIPLAVLATALSRLGAAVRGEVGQIYFLGRCLIGGSAGLHMVLSGEDGPLSVLLMPSQPVERRRQIIAGTRVVMILPSGPGSLAVVGNPGGPVAESARRIHQTILWPKRTGSL